MSQLTPREWLGLEATHNPHRWYLPVIPRLSVREIFLFGGAGLAAATTALEETTGRPVVWATAQYLDFAKVARRWISMSMSRSRAATPPRLA